MMRIHDEVMPEMGTMQRLGGQLEALQPQLDSSQSLVVTRAISDLETADNAMMDWMAALKSPLEKIRKSMPADSVLPYLQNETLKIEQVKTDMLESIEQAKRLLQEFSTK